MGGAPVRGATDPWCNRGAPGRRRARARWHFCHFKSRHLKRGGSFLKRGVARGGDNREKRLDFREGTASVESAGCLGRVPSLAALPDKPRGEGGIISAKCRRNRLEDYTGGRKEAMSGGLVWEPSLKPQLKKLVEAGMGTVKGPACGGLMQRCGERSGGLADRSHIPVIRRAVAVETLRLPDEGRSPAFPPLLGLLGGRPPTRLSPTPNRAGTPIGSPSRRSMRGRR